MKTILLFEVNIFKSGQIALLCNKLNIALKKVQPKDYNKPLAALAGIKKSKKLCDCPEKILGGEMMVGIPPIKRKAALTASNSMWDARQLFKHLEEHIS